MTLTGVGGVGKTRLAVEAARDAQDRFSDGAAFVGLASLPDPSLLATAVLGSLGLPEGEGRAPGEALRYHLGVPTAGRLHMSKAPSGEKDCHLELPCT